MTTDRNALFRAREDWGTVEVGDLVRLTHTNGDTVTFQVDAITPMPEGIMLSNAAGYGFTDTAGDWALEVGVRLPTRPGAYLTSNPYPNGALPNILVLRADDVWVLYPNAIGGQSRIVRADEVAEMLPTLVPLKAVR